MKFKKMYTENAYSFEKLELNFQDYTGVTTIILGRNLDKDTANGAGKSSILKILYWLLWGKDLNGAPLDSMINRNGSNGMFGYLEFEDRGHEFKIIRYKDYKGNKNGFKLPDGSVIEGSGVDFLINGTIFPSDGGTPAIQKNIEAKLSTTPRLFLSSVLTAQKNKKPFLKANDTDKKEILSELLDLQAYAKAFEAVKKEITSTEEKIHTHELRIEGFNEQFDKNILEIANLEGQVNKFQLEHAQKTSQLQQEITELQTKLNSFSTDILINQTPQLTIEKENLEKDIKSLKTKFDTEKEIFSSVKTLELEIRQHASKIIESQNSLDLNQNKMELLTLVADPEARLKTLTLELERFNQELTDLNQQIHDLTPKTDGLSTVELNLNSLHSRIGQIQKEINHLTVELQEVRTNSICSTCQRPFKVGDVKLDELLHNIEEKIKTNNQMLQEITNDEKPLATQLSLIKTASEQLKIVQAQKEVLTKNTSDHKFEEHKLVLIKKEFQKNELELKDLKAANLNLEQSIINHQKAIDEKNEELLKIQESLATFEELRKDQSAKESQLSNKIQEISMASLKWERYLQKQTQRQDLVNLIGREELRLTQLQTELNPYIEVRERLVSQNQGVENKIKELKKRIKELEEDLKYLNFWKLGYAPTGIRSFITDDVIELLNRKVQEYLNELYDGAIQVVFDPESKDSKGNINNKISTHFFLDGKESPLELLSGGEEERAVLATDLALNEVAEARAGTKFNLKFLDEPFDGIDSQGQIKALTLFSKLAKEKDGFFIISHDEKFQNMCNKAVYVVKDHGLSKLVDKAEFTNSGSSGLAHRIAEPKSSIGEVLARRRKKNKDEE